MHAPVALVCKLLVVACCMAQCCSAADWPQWLGPDRNSVWTETGVVERFREEGLTALWRVPVAGGYSGPAVADGRVVVMDFVLAEGKSTLDFNARDRLRGKERVLCFDSRTGKSLWVHAYDCTYNISYATGPRCTPAIDGGNVYTLGAEGDLYCLDVATGQPRWFHDLGKKYTVETPQWGFCGHPLVDGQKLLCLVGGEGSVAVAFDKLNGKELWRSLTAREPGYCPPTILEAGSLRQLIIWHSESVNSLHPETGKPYWSIKLEPKYGMSITAPRLLGDLLYASGIGDVSLVARLAKDRPAATVEWRGSTKKAVCGANSTPFLENGMIYGCDCQTGHLRGVKLATGERVWETLAATSGGERSAAHGTAFIVKHRDRFFLFTETGHLVIARLTPEKYEEVSRAKLLEPTGSAFGRQVVWSHPAFADQCVFARNDEELVCVSLAAR